MRGLPTSPLYLHGVGHCNPENEITNAFLADLDIGTSEDWILERTGIRSRRTVLPLDYIRETRNADVRATADVAGNANTELGRRAAEMAIDRAGIDRGEIGLVIAGGSLPERAAPAEACSIAAALDLDVPAFDVRSACTSFLAALDLLSRMRPESIPVYILVVVPESITRSVDYSDRSAAVLWGDGAAAAVVSLREPSRATVSCSFIESNPGGHEKVEIPWSGYFTQEGATVQTFAIKKTARVLRDLADRRDCDSPGGPCADDLHFIGHQANLLMLQSVCRMCDVEERLHHTNVERLGNTGAAGAPSVLSECWDELRTAPTSIDLAMVGVGAGLTWSGGLVRFEDNA